MNSWPTRHCAYHKKPRWWSHETFRRSSLNVNKWRMLSEAMPLGSDGLLFIMRLLIEIIVETQQLFSPFKLFWCKPTYRRTVSWLVKAKIYPFPGLIVNCADVRVTRYRSVPITSLVNSSATKKKKKKKTQEHSRCLEGVGQTIKMSTNTNLCRCVQMRSGGYCVCVLKK